jgi:carboxy-terminal domain RNA polymerase II polypeptide A small phosphatase
LSNNSLGPPLLRPQQKHVRGRKTLILDVDETLVHSSF